MYRSLIIAPIVFVVLSLIGLPDFLTARLGPAGSSLAGLPATIPVQARVMGTVRPAQTTPVIADSRLLQATGTPAAAILAALPTATPVAMPTSSPSPTPYATATPARRPPVKVGSASAPSFGAREVVIVDDGSGAILFEQAAHRRVAPASTTKIVTAIVALQRSTNWKEVVTARFDETELVDSTLMGVRRGERISMEDLLFGLMLPSGNDAALAIATHVAGGRSEFADLMNGLATRLGLANSHFVNPHGLDERNHYSSAYDMVQFARYGMRDDRFRQLSLARRHTVQAGERIYEVFNLNRLLAQYEPADGVKIGYTEDAGRTIVASATVNGRRVYIGAFHSADLVGDVKPLFEWVFHNHVWPD